MYIYYTFVVDKLIFVAKLNSKKLKSFLLGDKDISIYRSKGLLAHLLKRKHFLAVKYFDYIPDIIENPDYAGSSDGQIELVKCFNDNMFLCIKLDEKRKIYYVATLYNVSQSKIESYCKSGRLSKVEK